MCARLIFIPQKSALTHITFSVCYFIWGTRNPILCQRESDLVARCSAIPFLCLLRLCPLFKGYSCLIAESCFILGGGDYNKFLVRKGSDPSFLWIRNSPKLRGRKIGGRNRRGGNRPPTSGLGAGWSVSVALKLAR